MCVLLLAPAGASAQASTGGATYVPPPPPAKRAKIVGGIAIPPIGAPTRVMRAIAAANRIIRKPYVYGGGHKPYTSLIATKARLDRGYDCSGSVSFALYGGRFLKSPLDSSSFMSWGRRGKGQWITVYTNPGHAYVVIAGLRFDTSGGGPHGCLRAALGERPALAQVQPLARRLHGQAPAELLISAPRGGGARIGRQVSSTAARSIDPGVLYPMAVATPTIDKTDEQKAITDMVRQFADEQILPNAEHYDHEDEFPEPIVEQMKELGLFGVTIPEEYGGMGLDLTTYSMIVEELSRGWISISGDRQHPLHRLLPADEVRHRGAASEVPAADGHGRDPGRVLAV